MSVVVPTAPLVDYLFSHATTGLHCSIETSGEINELMKMPSSTSPRMISDRSARRLYGAKFTIMGLANKKNDRSPKSLPRSRPSVNSETPVWALEFPRSEPVK